MSCVLSLLGHWLSIRALSLVCCISSLAIGPRYGAFVLCVLYCCLGLRPGRLLLLLIAFVVLASWLVAAVQLEVQGKEQVEESDVDALAEENSPGVTTTNGGRVVEEWVFGAVYQIDVRSNARSVCENAGRGGIAHNGRGEGREEARQHAV